MSERTRIYDMFNFFSFKNMYSFDRRKRSLSIAKTASANLKTLFIDMGFISNEQLYDHTLYPVQTEKKTTTKKKKTSLNYMKMFLKIFTSHSSSYLPNTKLFARIFISALWWISGAYSVRLLGR